MMPGEGTISGEGDGAWRGGMVPGKGDAAGEGDNTRTDSARRRGGCEGLVEGKGDNAERGQCQKQGTLWRKLPFVPAAAGINRHISKSPNCANVFTCLPGARAGRGFNALIPHAGGSLQSAPRQEGSRGCFNLARPGAELIAGVSLFSGHL